MKKWKQVFAIVLSISIFLSTDSTSLYASQENVDAKVAAENSITGEVIDSGTCGDNLTWTLTEDKTLIYEYILTISGTGAMYDYDWDKVPWFECRERLIKLVFDGL